MGTVIEKVTGERFDIYQKNNILKQLNTQADYLVSNLDRSAFRNLGTIYRKKNYNGEWNENGPWYAMADDYYEQTEKNTIILQDPLAPQQCKIYSFKNYKPGTNATAFSPQGGLRISFHELSNTMKMIINNGSFDGYQVLSPESIATINTPCWKYEINNGDTCGGTIFSYGLGTMFIDGTSPTRVCRNYGVDLVGHTGEAYGLLAGFFQVKNRQGCGFLYIMNGEGLERNSDARSMGEYSNNYIWEEKIMNAICTAIMSE